MEKDSKNNIWLLTGLSGAGLSTALKTMEDLGFEAVDNLPLSMVEKLVAQAEKPVAIGIDCRTRDFSAEAFQKVLHSLNEQDGILAKLLMMTCQSHVLQHRFNETRRRHPLAIDRPVRDGIQIEKELIAPLFEISDLSIDTSELSVHDLRRLVAGHCQISDNHGLLVCVTSFGYSNGIPREADLLFDVRFLNNPHYVPELQPLTGRDEAVANMVKSDPYYNDFFTNLTRLLKPLLPRYQHEGKKYLTIGVGCTGGRHRSVCTAEELYKWLDEQGYSVSIQHRDLQRWAANRELKKQQQQDQRETA